MRNENLNVTHRLDFKDNLDEIMNNNDKIVIKRREDNMIMIPLQDYNSLQEAANKWYIMSH